VVGKVATGRDCSEPAPLNSTRRVAFPWGVGQGSVDEDKIIRSVYHFTTHLTLISRALVGEVGFEPTKPKGAGFTLIRCILHGIPTW